MFKSKSKFIPICQCSHHDKTLAGRLLSFELSYFFSKDEAPGSTYSSLLLITSAWARDGNVTIYTWSPVCIYTPILHALRGRGYVITVQKKCNHWGIWKHVRGVVQCHYLFLYLFSAPNIHLGSKLFISVWTLCLWKYWETLEEGKHFSSFTPSVDNWS